MKAIALTFDYDLNKMKNNGRYWAEEVYGAKSSDIFNYSAASYATFINYNPNIILDLYTNDINLLKVCLERYNVSLDNVNFIDYSKEIEESKKHHYAFQPLTDLFKNIQPNDEYIIKIDNDLIWYNQIPKFNEEDILVWKFERYVKNGNPKMGEIKVCEEVCNDIDFKIYNIGVLGLPITYPINEFYDICNKMSSINIKSVSDLGVEIWHVSEQTAHCWIMNKNNYRIIELYNIVDHFYENKKLCIDKAKYLLKK